MGIIAPELSQKLLASIETDRLVIFAGAGLSMAHPSEVPSAAKVAAYTSKKYSEVTLGDVPAGAGDNLEILAEFLLANGALSTLFIDRLVEWDAFRRAPNKGHKAIADFLWCHAIVSAVTTNVDELIELASSELGGFLRTSLDGAEMSRIWPHAPFLKVHGCAVRDPNNTLWCKGQLRANPLELCARRVQESTTWLRANLVGRDLLFVGFWSDWAYLNSVLVDAIDANRFTLVVLVDPENRAKLQQKAPELWAWASKQQDFVHAPVSGADFLDELRALFCRSFMNRLLASATSRWPAWAGILGPTQALPETLTTEDLFALRRDSCGKPTRQVVTEKRPTAAMSTTGVAHLCFLNKGALVDGARYTIANKRLRIVNGAGMLLSDVRAAFAQEPPTPQGDDYVVCAGAEDDGGVPPNVIGRHMTPTVARPGSSAKWMTAVQALQTDFATETA
ncbi:MAG: hypothetical protein ABR920_11940 [Terriglobales bacterium]